MKTKCECTDKGCPVHWRYSCAQSATTTLHRCDMDVTVEFCSACADDALKSGFFCEEAVRA